MTNNFDFSGPNLHKKEFKVGNSKNCCWSKNQHPWNSMFTFFQTKRTTLTFWAQIWPNINVGVKISKIEVWIGNQHPWDRCAPIFRQNGQLWIFGPKFVQQWILGSRFKNLSLDSESTPPIYHVCQFSVKMENVWFFRLNLGKLPNYVQYMVQILLRVCQRARWTLKWAGWRWMEVSGGWNDFAGGRCGWVEVTACVSNTGRRICLVWSF